MNSNNTCGIDNCPSINATDNHMVVDGLATRWPFIFSSVSIVIISTLIGFLYQSCKLREKIFKFVFNFNPIRNHMKLTSDPFLVSDPSKPVRMREGESFLVIAQMVLISVPILSELPQMKTYLRSTSQVTQNYLFQLLFGAEPFFTLSGFMNCYTMYPIMVQSCSELPPGGSAVGKDMKVRMEVKTMRSRIPFHWFLLKRWMRLIPPLVFLILMTLALGNQI